MILVQSCLAFTRLGDIVLSLRDMSGVCDLSVKATYQRCVPSPPQKMFVEALTRVTFP